MHRAKAGLEFTLFNVLFRRTILRASLRFFNTFFNRLERKIIRNCRPAMGAVRFDDDVGIDQYNLVLLKTQVPALQLKRTGNIVVTKGCSELINGDVEQAGGAANG